MSASAPTKWKRWGGGLLTAVLVLFYFAIEFVAQERERKAANSERIRDEVADEVGESLRAGSEARQAALREALKPENLMKIRDPARP